MIPRLIHQTAKTSDIPEHWVEYQRTVQSLYPDWTYSLWTDVDNDAFVAREYPDFKDIFRSLPKAIMRADVIRYLLMDRLGGLYLDLDYQMLRPFDFGPYQCLLPLESGDAYSPGSKVCNAFFAAQPGHPFFARVIEYLKSDPPVQADADVLTTTGPAFLSRVLDENPELVDEMFIAPSRLFSPKTPRSRKAFERIRDEGVAHGVHHCDGTWREFSTVDRLKQMARHSLHGISR